MAGTLKTLLGKASATGKAYSATPAATPVPVRTSKTLASLALPAGTYVVTGGHSWGVDSPGTFVLSALRAGGAQVRIERGTMNGGGGSSMAAVVTKGTGFTVELEGYWGSGSNSGTVNATNIRLDAVRIA